MAFTLIRHTGRYAATEALSILVNEKEVGNVHNEQQVEIPLPSESATLQVTQYGGSHSQKMEVKEGDLIHITVSKWNYLIYIFPSFLLFLSAILLPTVSSKLISMGVILFISFVVIFKMNWFQLQRTEGIDTQ